MVWFTKLFPGSLELVVAACLNQKKSGAAASTSCCSESNWLSRPPFTASTSKSTHLDLQEDSL